MKHSGYYLLMVLFLFILSGDSIGQENLSKKEMKQEQFKNTLNLVESRNFIFEATRAFPQGGSSVDLTTNYGFLEVSDSTVNADLPFFGRAYRVDYGGNGGIEFSGKIENTESSVNHGKRSIFFSFEVKDRERFKIMMDIGYDGSTSLSVISNNRSSIRYSGDVSDKGDSE